MAIKHVTAKLGTMRKPQQFTVTRTDQSNYIVQSDKSIGMFDPVTRVGLLNQTGHYFPHLSPALGAKRYEFPPDFVQECQESRVLKGDEIGPGVFYAGATEIGS